MKKITEILVVLSLASFALESAAQSKSQNTIAEVHDGQHDFDFKSGTWKTHIKRLINPLAGNNSWVELNGIVQVTKVWNGKAYMEEIEAEGPSGHFEGLTLFLYNPQSHEWSMNFSNSSNGTLGVPCVGKFENGRGEFFNQETYKGRMIFVRFVWSDITADSHHVEQSFSVDGGKTWEPNFVADLTREANTTRTTK